MNILITGGVDFIGTNCCFYFSKNKNNKIYLLDDFSRPGVQKNAKYIIQHLPNTTIIKANILSTQKYKTVLKKADAIIHLAGQTAVTTSIAQPMLDFRSNLLGSIKLLEEVKKQNPKSILLFSSTNKVYGDLNNHLLQKNLFKKRYEDLCHPKGLDENEKIDFISPYGCSKGAADFYFQDYSRIYGLKTVIFRQSCIYGPFQIGLEDQGWVAHFTKQFLNNQPITIFGDGFQVRDLLYMDDLITAYELAVEKINQIKGEVFNIGGGPKNSFSLLEVIDQLHKQTGNQVKVKYEKARQGDQKYFVSSNKKIKKYLNWSPKTNFSQGLSALINWQKNIFFHKKTASLYH